MLLILDNFEHVLPGVRVLAPLLQDCAKVYMLCTSRIRLNIAVEWVLEVAPLAVPQVGSQDLQVKASAASELFVQRARAVQPGFALTDQNATDIDAIATSLEGLPLALELAAARIPAYGVAGLRRVIEQHGQAAVEGGGFDRPLRHRSLAASLAWSFGLLDADHQTVLHALSLFVEPFDAPAASALCAAPGRDVAQAVLTLKDSGFISLQSLPSAATPTYGLHSLTREFLVQAPREQNKREADERAFFTYLANVAQDLNTQLERGEIQNAINGFASLHASFFKALELAEQHQDVLIGCKLVRHLALYWARSSAFSRAQVWVQRAIQWAHTLSEDQRGYLLLTLGYYFVSSVNPEQGYACAQQALTCAKNSADQTLIVKCGLLLSGAAASLGLPAQGIEALEQIRVYASTGISDPLWQKMRVNLGVCYLQSSDLKAASVQWLACDTYFKHQKTQARVSTSMNLALLANYQGRVRRALRLARFAYDLEHRGPPQPNRVLQILLRHAWILCCNAQPVLAIAATQQAGELVETAAFPNLEETLLFQRGKIYVCQGNWARAAEHLSSAVQDVLGRADPWDLLDSRIWLYWALHHEQSDMRVTGGLLNAMLETMHGWQQERPRVLEAAAAWLCRAKAWDDAAHAWQAAQTYRQTAGLVRFVTEESTAKVTWQLILANTKAAKRVPHAGQQHGRCDAQALEQIRQRVQLAL